MPRSLLVLLAACSDYEVNGKDDANPPFDDGDTAAIDTDTDGETGGDSAGGTCAGLSVGVAGPVTTDPACEAVPTVPDALVEDPWRLRVQWQADEMSSAMPVVANLDDDDGDGDVDGDDVPEVLVVAVQNLVVLDGATGTVKWRTGYVTSTHISVAVADVDADGFPDVVLEGLDGRARALEADGTLQWISSVPGQGVGLPVDVADLDGDGAPEVVHGNAILEGATGDPLARLYIETLGGPAPAIGDLDRDGDQEVYIDGQAFDSDGTPLWDVGTDDFVGNWALIVQADADPEGEIAWVGKELIVTDADGTELVRTPLSGRDDHLGAPSAGDFDGDGVMEIVFARYFLGGLTMIELDGTVVWEVLADTRSYGAGVMGYDFDGDGALEVVWPADEDLYVVDGRTGEVRMRWADHEHPTAYEYAVVADVDRDDHAEIVLASIRQDGQAWITALEHDGDGWPAAGPSWADYAFHVTDVAPTGAIPTQPEPSWLRHKVFRARTAVDGSPGRPDLAVEITDVCVADCDEGPVHVAVQVRNEGVEDVGEAVISLYAVDEGAERLVATGTVAAVPGGEALAGVVFELTPADVGARGFRAVVDEAGLRAECVETNNEDRWVDVSCP